MIANYANELGRKLQDRGSLGLADAAYATATRLEPDWPTPWFNRGLMAKFRRRWPECYRFNLKATELDPTFEPAWWNLGIAATALSDWVVARRAWWRYGIEVPLGDGPPDMDLGPVPIRVCPGSQGEVVWCQRLDPARAMIRSIPLPESRHAYGDILLQDGEPKGHRFLGDHKIPVFNELEIHTPSDWSTFSAELTVPSPEAAQELRDMTAEGEVIVEDWSTLRILCKQCSEGTPHEHAEDTDEGWKPNRLFGLAATAEPLAAALLDRWRSAGPGRDVGSLVFAFSHPKN